MSLLLKGVARLSQLEVDTGKDWEAKEITNLRSVAIAMAHGDIAFRGVSVLEKLAADAGKGYSFLRSRGPGLAPVWQDIESLVQYMTGAVNRAAAFDLSIPSPAVLYSAQQASSPPGRTSVGVLSPPEPEITVTILTGPGGAVALSPSLDAPVPAISGQAAIGAPLGGAVADDGGVQTNETAPANNDAANDMTLLPSAPAVNDSYYFGRPTLWDWLELRMGTAGNGTWDIAWEYWNGAAWLPLPDVIDNTSGLKVSGTRLMTFTRPLDWAQNTISGISNQYWVRARVSVYVSIVTQPKGTRAFAWIKQ
ncbi:hypothetical protein [Dehalococcoides mccartyi]|uniref:hypothetical protein n=1 Tax=Dehalococcoides mccartyi TaxID=61435 RepID=UPI0002B77223|nr:hypothetical protein [Dehalococcoides mccartyi]AGG05927.1 hypothetical protein dcmb_296 [Dehalococcoides mccartyi DCMB5]